jgi:OmcA/MtrC family decaheme c-type cytochrome
MAACGGSGKDGINGKDGANGTNGIAGTDGIDGIDGIDGTNGTVGTNGTNGTNGLTAIVETSAEAAGVNCIDGGTKIDTGLDTNGNGTLEVGEITDTTYACNGAVGGTGTNGTNGANGHATLVVSSTEAGGVNCGSGGQKIEVGLDLNDDGVLDAGEINAALTTYVCNGHATLMLTTAEPAGANCPGSGRKIDVGVDVNDNGVLDAAEVNATATTYVCNGADGNAGSREQCMICHAKGKVAGISFVHMGVPAAHAGLVVAITGVTGTGLTGDPITVAFNLKDTLGHPVDTKGIYSVNTAMAPRFGLAYIPVVGGMTMPYKVYTKSGTTPSPTAYNSTTAGAGTVTEVGTGLGTYTYAFPTTTTAGGAVAVAWDPAHLNDTHTVWMQISRQWDLADPANPQTFLAVDKDYNFLPPGGVGVVTKREIVLTANCNECHRGFMAEATAGDGFHSGGRVEGPFCNICHNPDRASNTIPADSAVFVHRLHRSEHLDPDMGPCSTDADCANGAVCQGESAGPPAVIGHCNDLFHDMKFGYPQDIRNCNQCHGGALQGAQMFSRPNRIACGSCHNYVDFTGSQLDDCVMGTPVEDADGYPITCNHFAGPQPDDTNCAGCHTAANLPGKHLPIVPPDPNNLFDTPVGGNDRTNAAYLAAAGALPTGAIAVTWEIKSVQTVPDAVDPTIMRPQMTFRFNANAVPVVFQTFGAGITELMPNFVGSPAAYFVFAVPQDGIATPGDFNVSTNTYIKNVWNGTATGSGAGTLADGAGADVGYYVLTLTGVMVPTSATMLTGGIGYNYQLSVTQPLTQTNVVGYTFKANKAGGLIVPAPNIWKVATGYTGRRAIVDNAKCNSCHAPLGVAPTFHAGQRNDGPSCSFCHTANRTSSGWSANSKDFVHAIHGGRVRSVPYNWHAASPTQSFAEVEFAGALNDCTSCHAANTFDFSASASVTAFPNLLYSTVATGKYDGASATAYTLSPYVVKDNIMDYGKGFSFDAVTGITTEAVASTLVKSPIVSACSACHDSPVEIDHMSTNGGRFYETRFNAFGQ